jgi:hypothetical protein
VSSSPEARDFARRVREAAEGSPYVVTETERGFDVALDFSAQWYGLFNKAGMRRAFTHHVSLPEPGVYVVSDEARDVDWVAGAPRLAGSVEVFHGRRRQVAFEQVWALDEHGRFGRVADYRFDSEEGRRLVEGVAEQLGLTQRRGTAEKVGLYVALGVVALMVVMGLAVAAVALFTDYFG